MRRKKRKRLRQSNDTYDEVRKRPTYRATFALSADVVSDRPGSELVTASLASGIALFDAHGKLIARGAATVRGILGGLFGIALAQIVPDPGPDPGALRERRPRIARAGARHPQAQRRHAGDGAEALPCRRASARTGTTTQTATSAPTQRDLSLASEGSLLSQAAGERQPSILRWNVASLPSSLRTPPMQPRMVAAAVPIASPLLRNK